MIKFLSVIRNCAKLELCLYYMYMVGSSILSRKIIDFSLEYDLEVTHEVLNLYSIGVGVKC